MRKAKTNKLLKLAPVENSKADRAQDAKLEAKMKPPRKKDCK